jgi:prophage regulatory protein
MRKLLRLPAVKEATGLGRSSIYTLIQNGKFPPPIKIDGVPGISVWNSDVVENWIEKQIPD